MRPRSTRLPTVLLPLAVAGLALFASPASAAPPAKPNIIFIVTDDQDLLLDSLKYMPRVHDLLANQGTTFSHAFVPLSLCCPSRTSILTGRYTHNTQVYTNSLPDGGFARFYALGLEQETVAVALQKVGYRTAILGKYLNDYPLTVPPTYVPPGWNEWVVPSDGAPYTEFNYTLNENGSQVKFGHAATDYMTDVLAKRARRFITKAAADRVPFFLYLTPYAPHKPCTPAPRHAALFPGLKAPRTPSFNEADVSDKPEAVRNLPLLTPELIDAIDHLYRLRLQSLQAVDEAVGSIVQLLEATGQMRNTYIIFTSDNGFHQGQHRLFNSKYTAYEEDVRVPLIVRGPHVPANRVVDALTENVDFAPTIAQLAGATLSSKVDGRSLVPLLRSGPVPPSGRQTVLLEQFHFTDGPGGGDSVLEPGDALKDEEHVTHRGLRTATFKFVEYGTGEHEYYDLVKDPYELENLASHIGPLLMGQLTSRLNDLSQCQGGDCRALEAEPVPGLP
ncbi:MAG TPA: sulfatase-like hydrolase/transferase [Thermoanaerobaculia bacterium]|nr:sulfatase-like hydrolase/transferase [Thermoanaerobaculia bacterium]